MRMILLRMAVIQLRSLPTDYDQKYAAHTFVPLNRNGGVYAWGLERIRGARDAQMLGDFYISAELAEAMKTDGAIFGALLNRLAPHRGLTRVFESPKARIRKEAEQTFGRSSSRLTPAAVADMLEKEIMLGVAVGQNVYTPRADGSRIDVTLEPWPMRSVRWNPHTCTLQAQTRDGLVDIVHGDGKWVVWSLHTAEPWHWGAVKPLALVWADRAFGIRDRSQHAESQGIGKLIGELPEGIAIDSPEGQAFAQVIQALRYAQSGAVIPSGAIVKMLESVSASGWQIFRELIESDTKEIARIVLGQDGSLQSEGGNYIKAAQLYGVRQDIVEGDLDAAASAINTGTLRPWSSLNFGEVDVVTTRWLYPDPDEDARRESLGKRIVAFNLAIQGFRENGFQVDQKYADNLGAEMGVSVPELGEAPPLKPSPASVVDNNGAPDSPPPGE